MMDLVEGALSQDLLIFRASGPYMSLLMGVGIQEIPRSVKRRNRHDMIFKVPRF